LGFKNIFFKKICFKLIFLAFSDRFDVLISKLIFKNKNKYYFDIFQVKSTLKTTATTTTNTNTNTPNKTKHILQLITYKNNYFPPVAIILLCLYFCLYSSPLYNFVFRKPHKSLFLLGKTLFVT